MAEKNGEGHIAGEVQKQQEECWQLAEEWPLQLDLEVKLQLPKYLRRLWAAPYSRLNSAIYCG